MDLVPIDKKDRLTPIEKKPRLVPIENNSRLTPMGKKLPEKDPVWVFSPVKKETAWDKVRPVFDGDVDFDSLIPQEAKYKVGKIDPDKQMVMKAVNSAIYGEAAEMDYSSAYQLHDLISAESFDLSKIDAKTVFERIGDRYRNGKAQVKIADAGYDMLVNGITDEKLEKVKALQGKTNQDFLKELRGFWEKNFGALAEQTPNMIEAAKAGGPWAVLGGFTFGGVTAVAGNLGPQALSPEEVVTVPAATITGIKVGGGLGAANRIREIEAGSCFVDLIQMEDEYGNKIDPKIAKAAAHGVGLINGGIELLEWAVLLETFGVGTEIFEKAAAKATTKLAAEGTFKHLLLKYTAKYGMALGTETLQELEQESVSIAFEELAKAINNERKGTKFKKVTKKDLIARYKEVGEESLRSFGLLVAPGTAISGVSEAINRDGAAVVSKKTESSTEAKSGALKEKPPVEAEITPEKAPAEAEITGKKQAIAKEDVELEDLDGNPILTNEDGTITLYHRTTPENAEQIRNTGKFKSKEQGQVFFSTKEAGQADGYGDSLVIIRIKPDKVSLDDAFSNGEVHVSINNTDITNDNIQQTTDQPKVRADAESVDNKASTSKQSLQVDIEEEDVELTDEEQDAIDILESDIPESDAYEIKRHDGRLVIIEKETGKEVEVFRKRKPAKAKLNELNKDGKPLKGSRRKPKIFGKTISKLIKEETALKASIKKAAQAARKAFTEGKKTGVAKMKEHYAELREKQRAVKEHKEYIKKLVTKITRDLPQNIDFKYKQAIELLRAGVDEKFRTKKTLAQRQKILDYLAKNPGAIKTMPAKILKKVAKKDLRDFTTTELEELADTIEKLTAEGKQAYKAEKSAQKLSAENTANKIADSILDGKKPTGDVAPQSRNTKKKYKGSWWARLQSVALDPMRIFDLFDGGKGEFSGEAFTLFIDEVNNKYAEELDMVDRRKFSIGQKMAELGVTLKELSQLVYVAGQIFSVQELMGIYAAAKNMLSLEAMQFGNRLSDKTIRDAVAHLTPKQRELADWIISEYEEHYDRLRDAFIVDENKDLGRNESYTPIVRLDRNTGEVTDEQIKDQLMQLYHLKEGQVNKGMTIGRLKISPQNQNPIDLRLLTVWMEQIARQEHYIHTAKLLKKLRMVSKNKTLRQAIKEKFGNSYVKAMDEYVDRVANPDIYKAFTAIDKIVRALRKHVAIAYLAYNLLTIAKQIPSMALYMADAGVGRVLAKALTSTTDPMKLVKGVWEKDPLVKHIAIEREIEEFKHADKNGWQKLQNRIGTTGMIGIRWVDQYVRCIGWQATYEAELAKGKTEEQAIRQARNVTLRTQPNAFAKDLARIYTQNSFLNAFIMFTNQLNKIWNITTHDTFAYWKNEQYAKSALSLFGVALSGSLIWMIQNKRVPDEPEDAAEMVGEQFVNSIPIAGKFILSGMKGYDAGGIPITKPIEATGKALGGNASEDELWEAISIATGLPYIGPKRALKFLEKGDPVELIGGKK